MEFTKLGPYRLGRKLGQGGMGAVYQGVDESTGEVAAIKILSPHLAGDDAFRVRFEAEIESLKKLHHPNIVRLYGYGEEGDYLFYAMELVDGTSLEDEIRAGRRFDWREVTDLAIKLSKALKHAHDHGIIHRDIKPANLLISASGEIRLSDFGIARLFGNTRMTSDGGLLGTAEYMAPEQADGRPVSERCDQYSLGGVMYALLAGRPPFRAAGMLELLQLQRFAEPQPVRRYAPDTPAELERIISQLLEKDPQKRFVNTLILARALEAMSRGLSLSSQRGDFETRDPALSSESGPPVDAMAPTLVPKESSVLRRPAADVEGYALERSQTEMGSAPPSGAVERESPPVARFTKVEDTVADYSSWDDARAALSSWQTILAAVGLLAIAMLFWSALRGATADERFAELHDVAEENQPAALEKIEAKLHDFLTRWPDDPRVEQVQTWTDEVEDLKRQRRAADEIKLVSKRNARSPIERAYRDAALNLKQGDPEVALRKFRALVALYGSQPAEAAKRWVSQAQAEAERIEKQLAETAGSDRAAVAEQLDRADELGASDAAAAEQIRRAVVTLYGGKSWLADLVERAQAALGGTPAAAHQRSPHEALPHEADAAGGSAREVGPRDAAESGGGAG